jgi:DNA-binding Lrp family transcriptional regulator
VFYLDSIDIGILRALGENCRASYQEMGRKLGMTANAVKKRVNKLIDSGTIHSFVVYLSPAMADVEIYLAIVNTEGMKSEEKVLNVIVEDPHVFSTGRLSDGTCIVFAEYEGSENETRLEHFLQEIEGITGLEIHKLRSPRGTKVDFKPLQLRVLNCLVENPRMPATEVATKTGLTPRRVRRIITQLVEGGGLNFVARLNLNAGPGVIYYAQLLWNESKATHTEVEYWLDKEFAGHYFDSHTSASGPMMLSLFVVDHLRDAEPLSRKISQGEVIESVKTIFPFPTKKNVRLQRVKLEKLLKAPEI